tara:strand:- start:235 stop:459 length:225 start_codon:yes stop_codon:yes gene_type:complete
VVFVVNSKMLVISKSLRVFTCGKNIPSVEKKMFIHVDEALWKKKVNDWSFFLFFLTVKIQIKSRFQQTVFLLDF